MKEVLGLFTLLCLAGASILVFLLLTRRVDSAVLSLRLRRSKWRRSEYVDEQGQTHVVLRRSVWQGDKEIHADPDVEIAVVDDADPERIQKLEAARLRANNQVGPSNYWRAG